MGVVRDAGRSRAGLRAPRVPRTKRPAPMRTAPTLSPVWHGFSEKGPRVLVLEILGLECTLETSAVALPKRGSGSSAAGPHRAGSSWPGALLLRGGASRSPSRSHRSPGGGAIPVTSPPVRVPAWASAGGRRPPPPAARVASALASARAASEAELQETAVFTTQRARAPGASAGSPRSPTCKRRVRGEPAAGRPWRSVGRRRSRTGERGPRPVLWRFGFPPPQAISEGSAG